MKVLYVVNAFTWGGAEKLVYDLALKIVSKVKWVGIVALYKNNSPTEKDMVQTLEEQGVNTLILNKKAGMDRIINIARIYQYARQNHVDIIHGHCSVPMMFSKIVGKLLHIPVVCTIHNTNGYSARREIMTAWMVSRYISIGQSAEEYMIHNLKINKKRIYRIYNAIDINLFENRKRNSLFWKQYGGIEGQIALINVARVVEQKIQMCLLRALKTLIDKGKTDIRLYILGYYEPTQQIAKELNEYIQDNSLEPYVKFLGMHKNVFDFLINADCFVMTSWYEGLSVAFLEAVVSGIPIIATDMPFVKELNAFAKCATVIPQDDDQLLASILYEKAYRKQTNRAISIFKKNFSIDKFVEEHLNIYQKMLSDIK